MHNPSLDVKDLSAGYGNRLVIADINLQVGLGEWFSLIGPNASGKSTLLHCITGQLEPLTGSACVYGHDMATSPHLAKSHIGFAHSPAALPGLLTGWQCLEVYAAAKNLSGFDVDVLDLAEEFRMMKLLPAFVDTYSLGTRQKLSVLLALLGNPRLVILDEAFNGLDPRSVLVLKSYLREGIEHGRNSVFLATHSLDIVLEYSTQAGLIVDGKLRKVWSCQEISDFRASGLGAFERVLAENAEISF